jgi:glycosyltransferase involved in cell wall biosynthesis
MNDLPLVSVVIPVREEEDTIAGCLGAVAAQDYPPDRLEVIVVDGSSTDRTLEVVAGSISAFPPGTVRVLQNEVGTISRNLNAALRAASGEVVCRVDAKSRIGRDYVRRCVTALTEDPARVVVGGAPVAILPRDTRTDRAIARAYNNRWTTGLSRYKRGGPSGPSDTVYLGAFRTERLRAAGGWDERLLVNEDFELNQRLAAEGVVWFDGDLRVGHVHGSRTLVDLFGRQRRLGHGKVRYWRLTGGRPRPRQWVLLAGPPVAAVGLVAWSLAGSRPGRRLLSGLSAGAAALVALEVVGADEPDAGGPLGHVAGALANVAVGSGWLVGIAEELARRPR